MTFSSLTKALSYFQDRDKKIKERRGRIRGKLGAKKNSARICTRIRVRAKDIIAMSKKTDEERKAKKKDKERKEISVKAIDGDKSNESC